MFSPHKTDELKLQNHLDKDEPQSLEALLKEWQENNTDKSFTEIISKTLSNAVKKRAYNCVQTLLDTIKAQNITADLNSLIQEATHSADGKMVLILVNNDFSLAAKHLFNSILNSKADEKNTSSADQLQFYLLTLLRFMSIDTVDKLIETFLKDHPENDSLSKPYLEIKERFLKSAPYISRYTKNDHIMHLSDVYHQSEFSDLKTGAKQDLKYGEERQTYTAELYRDLSNTPIENYIPLEEKFVKLPPSSKGTKRAACLLEAISEISYRHQKINDSRTDFRTLRTKEGQTNIVDRYQFAHPLINSVFRFSKAIDHKKHDSNSYSLFFKKKDEFLKLNYTTWPEHEHLGKWEHGTAPLSSTWGNIEDLFEELWSMDLKKPDADAKSNEFEEYKEKLTQFYAKAAQLVWLIGNTQPMKRGSGTFAELMLNLIHMRHNLQAPILKTDFPQLDVLDITFPLSDYQAFFTYFFEPSTVPKHLQFPEISPELSVEAQMKQLYQIINEKRSASTEMSTSLKDDPTGLTHRFS